MQRAIATVVATGMALIVGCIGASAQQPPAPALANPASQNCAARGGVLTIERRPDGGQFGVCVFADNRQCEEWAMFRGECPLGGLRVTGYLTPAARYCAITGGRPVDTGCLLPGGKTCDAAAYFAGSCARKE